MILERRDGHNHVARWLSVMLRRWCIFQSAASPAVAQPADYALIAWWGMCIVTLGTQVRLYIPNKHFRNRTYSVFTYVWFYYGYGRSRVHLYKAILALNGRKSHTLTSSWRINDDKYIKCNYLFRLDHMFPCFWKDGIDLSLRVFMTDSQEKQDTFREFLILLQVMQKPMLMT